MARRLGSSTISTILAVAGFTALGVAGYRAVTGECLLTGACGDKVACSATTCDDKALTTEATVVQASNVTATETKGCCPLSKAAAVASGSCSEKSAEPAAQVINASATTTSSCAEKAACSEKASCDKGAEVINASTTSSSCAEKAACSEKASCDKSAEVINAAATTEKSGCCKDKANAQVINASATTTSSCAEKAACSEKASCDKGAEVINAAATTEKSGCCKEKAGAQVINASTTSSCAEKAACSEKASCDKSAEVINAAATTEKSGCCKDKANAQVINASNTSACSSQSSCTKSAAMVNASNSTCSKSASACSSPCRASLRTVMVRGSRIPVVIPAVFVRSIEPTTADLEKVGCGGMSACDDPNAPAVATRFGIGSKTVPAAYNDAVQTDCADKVGCCASKTQAQGSTDAALVPASHVETCGNGKTAAECCGSEGKCKDNPAVDCNSPKNKPTN